ncbi:MAG: hypothetical protein J2P41_11030 [Blastocatellia bacterium]|nr:hypothetical protein [Blastocatellia bacterium]
MRKISIIMLVLGAALALTSCAPSLHPFFTDENIIVKDELLGAWLSDSGEKCKFSKGGEDNYELLYVDDGAMRFEAQLFELGGKTYLDLYPKPMSEEINSYPNLVAAHLLARVEIGQEAISLSIMDGDWFERNDPGLAHERLGGTNGTNVLTASTRELQAFLLKHADDKDLFGQATVFHRLKPNECCFPTKNN